MHGLHFYLLFLMMRIPCFISESKWLIIDHDCHEINYIACGNNSQNFSSLQCFPSVIIGGTQKSGTTALAALLSLHPNISLAAKKEVHFFDKSEAFKKGLNFYLRSFNIFNVSAKWREVKLSVDATPSYISSRVSCRRISSSLPYAKLLILLRNPVSRAYSEYQMKARRVKDQREFFELILKNQEQFRRCFDTLAVQHHSGSNDFVDSLKECSPKIVTAHSRWPKLMVALRNANNVLTSWKAVFDLCFRRKLPPLQYGLDSSYPPPYEYCNASQQQCDHIANEEDRAVFDPLSCWSYAKHGFEVLSSLEKAFTEEIREFETCASPFVGYTEDYSQLDNAVEECVKVKSGISTQYFYRSLYVAQLIHCYKFIDPRKLLLLSDEELRRSPEVVLRRVIEFIGLKVTDDFVTSVRDRDIGGVVMEAFPKFEKSSGWKLQGDYEPIPERLKLYLQEFFRPFNRMLYQLTREPFIQIWDT